MRSAYICIFAVALLLRLWFNFFASSGSAAFACDAAEYLRHAQNMSLCFASLIAQQPGSSIACLHVILGNAATPELFLVKQIFLPLQSMSISGPVFPAFLLICYKIFGQNPSLELWQTPLFIQSILCALTATLIASIGNRCWNKQTGITAGIIAALYPGFIINSGRLYSESFACFLLCLILFLLVRYLTQDKQHYLWGIPLGACLFSLQTTRSIMIILTLAVGIAFVLASIFNHKNSGQARKYLISIVIGFMICLLPWLVLQKLAFGKTSLIVDRVGNYNFFVGNNADCLGWLSIPYPDLAGIEKQNYGSILNQAVARSPERFFKLILDKPTRLFKLPWNDFRSPLGPLSMGMQVIFHQLILLFAAIGLFISFCQSNEYLKQPKYLARLCILFAFALNLTYLAFITVPRYAFTAMPELILFAAAGLFSLYSAFQTKTTIAAAKNVMIAAVLIFALSQLDLTTLVSQIKNSSVQLAHFSYLFTIVLKLTILALFFAACWQFLERTVLSLNRLYAFISILLVALFTLPAYCLPLRAHGRWYESSIDFHHAGQQLERHIILNPEISKQIQQHEAYLAINIEGGSNLPTDWHITINGTKINGPFIPAMALAQDLSLVHLDNNKNLTIEQESILQSLCNVSSTSPLDLRQWYLIPVTLNQTSQTNAAHQITIKLLKCANSANTLYSTIAIDNKFSIMPSLFRFSWEKAFYGVENEHGLSDPAYDQKIALDQTYSSNNQDNVYIKLLVPKLVTNINGHKIAMDTPADLLPLAETQHQEIDSKNKSVISFTLRSSLLHKKDKNAYCLIRLLGTITGGSGQGNSTNTKRANIWTRIIFSQKADQSGAQDALSFVTPWVPNQTNLNSATNENDLKFDICFPLLSSVFPQPAQSIELHLSKNDVSPLNNSHINCQLEIYEMPRILSGVQYEIL